jgi:peptide/nickel transport system permease protein
VAESAGTVMAVEMSEDGAARLAIARARKCVLLQLRRRPLVVAGGVGLVVLIAAALMAPLFVGHDPLKVNLGKTLQSPSLLHLLGTDDLGRDVFGRLVYGARVSLQAGLFAVFFALVVGVGFGLAGGFAGRWLDESLMRVMDAILSFPSLVLALAITSALGASLMNAIIAIGIVYTPYFARLTRGQVLTVKQFEFIEAAHAEGASTLRIVLMHVLPNITAPIIAQSVLSMAGAIITEASLSFLGVGVQPPTPSWGGMLRMGYGYVDTAPWLSIAPGLAIFFTVLAFNFFGDGVQDVFDPRRR